VVLFGPSSIAADLETVERLEATARRDDPRGAAICAEARRGYRALAAQAGRGGAQGIRLALLADVARLGETSSATPDAEAEALAEAADILREVVTWADDLVPSADVSWLRWLARAALADVIESRDLARSGCSAPTDDAVRALEGTLLAARNLEAPLPRVLALEKLAAARWARRELGALVIVLDELAPCAPRPWRHAMHRAHLAIARGQHQAALEALSEARQASPPGDLRPYLHHLEGALAAERGDLAKARSAFALARRGAFPGTMRSLALETLERDPRALPPPIELVAWEAPTFVLAKEPRYELAIEVWMRAAPDRRHARFIAERLAILDPRAQWRRMQAEALGVPVGRTHEVLLAELLTQAPLRVNHARFGDGTVVRDIEGGLKREVDFVTAGRKILLASALHVLDDD
jgi:tetratricopeptide (TPR) repeat protein